MSIANEEHRKSARRAISCRAAASCPAVMLEERLLLSTITGEGGGIGAFGNGAKNRGRDPLRWSAGDNASTMLAGGTFSSHGFVDKRVLRLKTGKLAASGPANRFFNNTVNNTGVRTDRTSGTNICNDLAFNHRAGATFGLQACVVVPLVVDSGILTGNGGIS
jgi:hypothetical protein